MNKTVFFVHGSGGRITNVLIRSGNFRAFMFINIDGSVDFLLQKKLGFIKQFLISSNTIICFCFFSEVSLKLCIKFSKLVLLNSLALF